MFLGHTRPPKSISDKDNNDDDSDSVSVNDPFGLEPPPTPPSVLPSSPPIDTEARESAHYASEVVEAAESSPLNRNQQPEEHQQHQADRRWPIITTTTIADSVSLPFDPRVQPLTRLTSYLSLLSSRHPIRQPATTSADGEEITLLDTCTEDVSGIVIDMGLNTLPYDLLLNIASYLDLYDIHALQLTSKNLYDFATTRPVYRKLANDLLRRCRALPLKGFQRITDLTTEQLIRSVNKATRYEVAWRYRAPKPIVIPTPDSILFGYRGESTNVSGSGSSSVVETRRGFDGSAAGVALGTGFGGSMGHSNYMDLPEAPAYSASSNPSLPGSSFASGSSSTSGSTSIVYGTSSTIARAVPAQNQPLPRNWYKVVSAPPDEDVDWLSPITSSYTLCATKSGKVVCWDVQTDSCLAEWNPGARWELWKCRVEFEDRTVFFTMARVLSGSYNDERVMEFVLMKLSFFDSPSGRRSPDPPVFSQVTEFKTTGVVMNVFLLDPSARLLSAFIWVASTNTIGLYALLDWDKDQCVFVDTGIECVVTSNWSCILYENHIVIHCEESDAAYQHFYPIDLLQAHSKALPNKRAIPTITAKLRPAKTLSKKFTFPRIDHMEFEDAEGEEEEESETESVDDNGVTYYVVPDPGHNAGDSGLFEGGLFGADDDEAGLDAMFYGWASSSSASAPVDHIATGLSSTSIMASSAAISSHGYDTSSSVIAQPQPPITVDPAHLHAPAPPTILIPIPNPPIPSPGSQTQAPAPPAPLLHPQPLPPPPPQLPLPPPPVNAAPFHTPAQAHPLAHIPIPPHQNPFSFPPWYPESAHFVRQWWPSLHGIPRVSCTVVLLASHDQDTHKTKFVLAQHYFRVPLSRLEWAGGMVLPTLGMKSTGEFGYATPAVGPGVNGHGITNGTTNVVSNGIRNGDGDVHQRQPEANSSGSSSSNSSSPSTTASYASTSNTYHSSSSFASSSSTTATAYSMTTPTPPSYAHQSRSHIRSLSSLGTSVISSSSQQLYTEEDEELDNALMQLWYVSKPFEVVCVLDGAEEEDEMGMERPRPLVAVDFGHAVWIEYVDEGDGHESEHGHERDGSSDGDTVGDDGAGEPSGSSTSGYRRGKSLLASMLESDGVDVDVDVDSGVDSNGMLEALQQRQRDESPRPQERQRRRSRKLTKALRFVTFPPFNENGIDSDPVELRRDSERERERRARTKGKGKCTTNIGNENENAEREGEMEDRESDARFVNGTRANGHGYSNRPTGGSISDRWREGHVRTLEIPDELDLDTVETINIDQSQGAVILSVREGKIFILCYE